MPKLIVSLTSYPGRIDSVKRVLDSLYAQTLRADEIILWLAQEEFPHGEAELPAPLLEDISARRFTLRWCDNLGSHKKYFYAMQEYPNDIIVTVDDDTFYHADSLQRLFDAHTRFPNAVAALTTAAVPLDRKLEPYPIDQWIFDFSLMSEPSMLLTAIGVGGVLYPPNAVDKRIFDKALILEKCTLQGKTCGDDILLKAGEMLKGTPVVAVEGKPYYRLPNTQQTALCRLMPQQGHKDIIIDRLRQAFADCFDGRSVQRLKRDADRFSQEDKRRGLTKKYWISRPSRDIEKQIGYLSLPGFSSMLNEMDCAKVEDTVQFAASVFNLYPSESPNDGSAAAIRALQKQVREIPGIEARAEGFIAIRGLLEYGVLLGIKPPDGILRDKLYMKNMLNWQNFLRKHPNCDGAYRAAFMRMLGSLESME